MTKLRVLLKRPAAIFRRNRGTDTLVCVHLHLVAQRLLAVRVCFCGAAALSVWFWPLLL